MPHATACPSASSRDRHVIVGNIRKGGRHRQRGRVPSPTISDTLARLAPGAMGILIQISKRCSCFQAPTDGEEPCWQRHGLSLSSQRHHFLRCPQSPILGAQAIESSTLARLMPSQRASLSRKHAGLFGLLPGLFAALLRPGSEVIRDSTLSLSFFPGLHRLRCNGRCSRRMWWECRPGTVVSHYAMPVQGDHPG